MQNKALKVRIYPTVEQVQQLSQDFGNARWWYNHALGLVSKKEEKWNKAKFIKFLPGLKKSEETEWLKRTYSQVLQYQMIRLDTAFKNFFEGRAGFPKFKSKHHKQSVGYPQNVKIVNGNLKFPGKLGVIDTRLHREIEGKIKTVTVSRTPTGKYFAAILMEIEGEDPIKSTDGKIAGIDLGIKDFAIVNDGVKTIKAKNPRHIKKHERNLKRKQQSLARQKKGSNSREKARKLVATVHERVANSRKDFLHKLSRQLVDDNQVIVVENLNVKGMVKNHKLAKSISDTGWGMFVNFLDYKLEREGKYLIEINRWFASSKTCSECNHKVEKLPLNIREWTCSNCGTHHDRDENAAKNIRNEGIRIMIEDLKLSVCGTRTAAEGGNVSLLNSVKTVEKQIPMRSEASVLSSGVATPRPMTTNVW